MQSLFFNVSRVANVYPTFFTELNEDYMYSLSDLEFSTKIEPILRKVFIENIPLKEEAHKMLAKMEPRILNN